MLKINKPARLLAALAVCGALALPASAQTKMSGKMSSSKMSGKTMSKTAADKIMMGMMSATDKKTYMAMSASEKALCMKMCMKPMAKMSSGSKMSGGKMSGKM